MLEGKIGHDYHVFVFPVHDQETKLEILSPGEVPISSPESVEDIKKRLNAIVNPTASYQEDRFSQYDDDEAYPDRDTDFMPELRDL
jgi:hypothetical protein